VSITLYREGDQVELVIRGVISRTQTADPAWHELRYGTADRPFSFRTDEDGLSHTLVTAAEWPPLAGDVWRDRNHARWMAIAIDCPECAINGNDCEDGYVALTSEFGARYPGNLQLLKADRYYGPFTLELPSPLRGQEPTC
jgi:hypothetical protein